MTPEEIRKLYRDAGAEFGAFLAEKRIEYGGAIDAVAAIMRILYPGGLKPEEFDVALVQVRMIDKHVRLAAGRREAAFRRKCPKCLSPLDEAREDALADLAGYPLRILFGEREGREEREK